MAKSPAWQRSEGKNPEGGLNEKGRASLRAAGHDIKRPQPEGGSRKDSFCARMKGMKAKLTSSETANDPDSRINKSLRKWNCHADGGAVDVARSYRADGGKLNAYEEWKKRNDEAAEVNDRYAFPEKYNVTPEEYRKGILSHGKYALATGGRAHAATGGDQSVNDGNKNYIQSLYKDVLGREADQGGMDYWTNKLNSGELSEGDILQQFAGSKEFQNEYQADPTKAVTSLYREALGRAPEQSGLDYWVNQAKSGMGLPSMVSGFLGSQEGQDVSGINQMYQDYTGNVATPEQIAQGKQLLGSGDDWSSFLNKTFPIADDSGNYDVAGGWQSKATKVPTSSSDLMSALGPIEQKYGLPQGYLMGMMGIESGYGTNQQRAGSQYAGAFQLSPQLRNQYNVSNPYDFLQSADAAAQYARDNAKIFQQKVGRAPTASELYGMHQQGAGGFSGIAANPNLTAAQALMKAAPSSYRNMAKAVNAIRQNLPSDLRGRAGGMSAQDFMDYYNQKFGNMLAGPDQLGQTAISSYYKGQPTIQTASFTPTPTLGETLAGQGAPTSVLPGTLSNPVPSINPSVLPTGYQPPAPDMTSGASVISPIPGSGVPAWTPQPTGMPNGTMSLYDTLGAGMYTAYGNGSGLGGIGNSGPGSFGGGTSSGPSGMGVSFGNPMGWKDGGAVKNAQDVVRSYRKTGGPVWDRPRPKSLGNPEKLSPDEKSSAKAAAKAAGRPYPNLVDNMRAAREDGGRLSPFMEAKIEDIGDTELGKYGIGPKAPDITKDTLKAGPEQSTWESIASKAMGDRPSPERRRFVEGMGTAADVAHMGSYLTPAAPYVGALDFARGLASGSPAEAVLGATGLPGKAAKAVGMAASTMMPESAEAGPYSKLLRELAEKYRPHYDPAARIFGQPREKWLSEVKLSRPLDEMRVTSQAHRPMVAERFTRPEDYAGKAMITGLGDRTPAGYEVTSINDRILNAPTDMRGGRNFGLDVSSLGPDKAVWGSALSRAQAIANKAKAAADKDYDPIFAYVAQGPQSGDFSHHMQDLVLGQMDPSKMDPKLAAKIDKRMREASTGSGETFDPKPDWVGVQSPEAAARMRARADERVKLIKEMDAAAYRNAPGFADVGASRFASTDPDLMFDPSFSAGKSFMSIDPTGRVVENPAHPHPSYDTFIPAAPGAGHGYLGRLEYELPPELHFKHYLENEIKPSLRGKPLDKQTMSLLRQHPTVIATPEWVDTASEWQDLMRSLYGSRKP